MRGRTLIVGIALGAALCAGCTKEASDETPEGAVRMFLDAMERSERDPRALREAYGLMAASSRRGLAERARLAGSLGGRELRPWEMIARGRFRQSFAPARGSRGFQESIEGSTATVTVSSEDGRRSAAVPLVHEDAGWRLVLELPPVRGGEPATD